MSEPATIQARVKWLFDRFYEAAVAFLTQRELEFPTVSKISIPFVPVQTPEILSTVLPKYEISIAGIQYFLIFVLNSNMKIASVSPFKPLRY